MGLSQSTKDYWVAEIKTQIKAKVDKVLAENSCPELLNTLQQEAEVRCIEGLGMTDIVAEIRELDDRCESLDTQKKCLEERQELLGKKVAGAIRGIPEEDVKIGWNSTWKLGLPELAKQEIYPELLVAHPVGQSVAGLLESAKSIERSIMFATSPTALKTFLISFFKKFGIPYEKDMV